jgi:hypothetical protein
MQKGDRVIALATGTTGDHFYTFIIKGTIAGYITRNDETEKIPIVNIEEALEKKQRPYPGLYDGKRCIPHTVIVFNERLWDGLTQMYQVVIQYTTDIEKYELNRQYYFDSMVGLINKEAEMI